MIRIDYKNKISQINEVYWKWFSTKHLKEFKEKIEEDNLLKKYFQQVNSINGKSFDENPDEHIKKFLTELPEEHEKIKNFFEIQKVFLGRVINKSSKQFFLKRYKNYRKSQAPKILDILGIKVCPYCNRNYIDVYYDKKNAVRFNSDLDHFYPKEEYPYLAINPYNLIPCCKVCNQEKGSSKEVIFNPFMDNHIDLYEFNTKFSRDIKLEYLFGQSSEFNISINYKDGSSLKNIDMLEKTKNLLRLEDKYKKHKKYVKELIQKAYIYNDRFLEEIDNEMFTINVGNDTKLFEKDEIKKIIFQNDFDENRHNERSLSKLTYDILNEFKID